VQVVRQQKKSWSASRVVDQAEEVTGALLEEHGGKATNVLNERLVCLAWAVQHRVQELGLVDNGEDGSDRVLSFLADEDLVVGCSSEDGGHNSLDEGDYLLLLACFYGGLGFEEFVEKHQGILNNA